MAVEVRRSTCNRDCPDACGLVAEVRDGRIAALRGDPDHPVTRGFLCFRTSRFPELLEAENRLTAPLLRRGGRLVEVSWDEALDVAAERLLRIRAESGPAAVFHYRSGGSLGLLKQIADRFFEVFGPCTTKLGDICSGAGEAAQEVDFGVSDSNDLFDLHHARHVLVWGKNPFVSNVHLVPILKEIRSRGAGIVLVDPVHHRGATLADRTVQPRPGRDLELAFAVARELLDRGAIAPEALRRCTGAEEWQALATARTVAEWAALCDVPLGDVAALAGALADGPTAILVGWGMQRRARGAATVRALDALSAVSGNLWRSGGGCSFYFKRRGAFEPIATGAAARHVREPLFAADVLAATDPPIRAMWITAGNPVCMLPDSARVAAAIEQTEFVVVVDPFLTDTGRRADLVLPVPTLLEDSDVLGSYGHHWIAESRPLVDPPPGVRHEVEVFQELAARVGLGEHLAGSVEQWKRRLLARVAAHGASLEDLRRGAVRNPESRAVLFDAGTVPTPDGKVRLIEALPEPDLADADWPLWLFSSSSEKAQASQWARDPGDHLPVTVHPEAAPAGARAGEPVVVESRVGGLTAVLVLDARQRRDVALMPKGGHFDRGQSVNALVEARPTDLGMGAAYFDCRVRLRRP